MAELKKKKEAISLFQRERLKVGGVFYVIRDVYVHPSGLVTIYCVREGGDEKTETLAIRTLPQAQFTVYWRTVVKVTSD